MWLRLPCGGGWVYLIYNKSEGLVTKLACAMPPDHLSGYPPPNLMDVTLGPVVSAGGWEECRGWSGASLGLFSASLTTFLTSFSPPPFCTLALLAQAQHLLFLPLPQLTAGVSQGSLWWDSSLSPVTADNGSPSGRLGRFLVPLPVVEQEQGRRELVLV